MSKGSSCSTFISCSLSNNSDNNTSIPAKLRKLKIQQGLLLQNVVKIMLKNYDYGEELSTSYVNSDYKEFISKLLNSFNEVKNLFDSLKCITISREALKSCEIDDIKSDVMELEVKLRNFKNYLYSMHTSLKSEEEELINQINVLTVENKNKIINHSKIKARPFNDIVPSPVKNIITSPFKCKEVQQFQEFQKKYHRNGGWNDYSHNLFIQIWMKHFPTATDCDLNIDILEIHNSNNFIKEIIDKLPGITKEDIIQHSEWYLKYLNLKMRQQKALNKWKAKKKLIKKSICEDKEGENTEKKIQAVDHNVGKYVRNADHVKFIVSNEMKTFEGMFSVTSLADSCQSSDTNDSTEKDSQNYKLKKIVGSNATRAEKLREPYHFAKSTQQWKNMCKDRVLKNKYYVPQLENIEKLFQMI